MVQAHLSGYGSGRELTGAQGYYPTYDLYPGAQEMAGAVAPCSGVLCSVKHAFQSLLQRFGLAPKSTTVQATMVADGGPVTMTSGAIDPTTGMPIDPTTGLDIDTCRGLLYDPSTGVYYDPTTMQQVLFPPTCGWDDGGWWGWLGRHLHGHHHGFGGGSTPMSFGPPQGQGAAQQGNQGQQSTQQGNQGQQSTQQGNQGQQSTQQGNQGQQSVPSGNGGIPFGHGPSFGPPNQPLQPAQYQPLQPAQPSGGLQPAHYVPPQPLQPQQYQPPPLGHLQPSGGLGHLQPSGGLQPAHPTGGLQPSQPSGGLSPSHGPGGPGFIPTHVAAPVVSRAVIHPPVAHHTRGVPSLAGDACTQAMIMYRPG